MMKSYQSPKKLALLNHYVIYLCGVNLDAERGFSVGKKTGNEIDYLNQCIKEAT